MLKSWGQGGVGWWQASSRSWANYSPTGICLRIWLFSKVQHKSKIKQIDELIKSNDEKEIAIEKLKEDFAVLEEKDDSDDDEWEDVELQENETRKEEIEHPTFINIALEWSDKAYNDIEKLRKNSREAKVIVQKLDKELSELAFVYGQTHSEEYQSAVSGIKSFSNLQRLKKIKCLTITYVP